MDLNVLRNLSYGLYVLTTESDGLPYGCIINSAFQITSSPVKVAISLNRDNFTHKKILSSHNFALSVLPQDVDKSIIGTFGYNSGRDTDKFTEINYEKSLINNQPFLVDHAMSYLSCKVIDQLEVGTHTIFIGEVIDTKGIQPDKLEMTYRYYHEVLKGVSPKNAPTYIKPDVETQRSTKYVCSVCGYIYDSQSEGGIEFEDLDDSWTCPICGMAKEVFIKQN